MFLYRNFRIKLETLKNNIERIVKYYLISLLAFCSSKNKKQEE